MSSVQIKSGITSQYISSVFQIMIFNKAKLFPGAKVQNDFIILALPYGYISTEMKFIHFTTAFFSLSESGKLRNQLDK